jgi:branched-chain amino acid transport system permease protein
MNKTYLGRSIRAVSDDNVAASIMGISVNWTYGLAMGLALATAAIAGVVVGMPWTFYPTTGASYLIIAFGVVVIGGMSSMTGTLVAGLIFGLAQVMGGSNYGVLIAYVVLIVMLAVRPQGLFSK